MSPSLENSESKSRRDTTRLVYLVGLLLLFSSNCGGRGDLANRSASSETKSPAIAPSLQQASGLHIPSVQEVVFVSVDTVLVFPGHMRGVADEEVVNRDRVPLITQDGGEAWVELLPHTIEFRSITFSSVLEGWLANEQSELWKSTDGGATWTIVSKIKDGENSPYFCGQIVFTDALNGWVVDGPSLWRTEDGGKTWSFHEFPWFLFRLFVRGRTEWVASQSETGRNNVIYRTQDGGETWEEIELPNSMTVPLHSVEIEDLFFVDDQRGWLANTRSVYRTDDGGKSWQEQKLPGKAWIKSLCFIDGQDGWAAGWRPMGKARNESNAPLLHTTNGGDTWQKVDVGARERGFEKVYFGDPQNGWLVALEGEEPSDGANIYRTRDGGRSWKRVLKVKSPYDLEEFEREGKAESAP